jgi:LPS sulfotransferase NodH
MDSVLEAGTTANGVFGAKTLWGQFRALCEHPECASLPLPDLMPALFPNPRYIWLTRRDKVRQAISWWRARETEQWHRHAGEPVEPVEELPFDFEQIDGRARKIIVHESLWQEYFQTCGVVPFTVVYEDLVADYEATTRRVLEYLAIPAPVHLTLGPPRLQKLADAQSEAWVRRFMEQAARPRES